MKKMTILSKESVFGGYLASNLGELADSLAVSLTSNYNVSLVCIGAQRSFFQKLLSLQKSAKTSKLRFAKIDYYFVEKQNWESSFDIIEQIKPDILHVMSEVEDIERLTHRPEKIIYSFDSIEAIKDKQEYLSQYDSVVATSPSLLDLALQDENLAQILLEKKAVGINNGMLANFFSPENKLFLRQTYSLDDLTGKRVCKDEVTDFYGIPRNSCLFVTGSLTQGTSIKNIINLIPYIKSNNGHLIVATRVPYDEERALLNMNAHDGVSYLGNSMNPARLPWLVAGADYFIQPNNPRMGSFAASAAVQYGAIPILDLNNIGLFAAVSSALAAAAFRCARGESSTPRYARTH